ncbi:MAG: restriction endonuclease [Ignavibacteria bacterium]|nr:restriction endonuclease [Ignavibacteria bacterium]MBK9182171.1 restriction endonuclease [Ignavibacteria bacterium]
MSVNNGKEFENIAECVYQAIAALENGVRITRNVRISSLDGPREFDIVLEAVVGGETVTTVIECRDLSVRANVAQIDGLASKIDGVPSISKGVIVTRKGFSKTALAKAKRLGISTYTLDSISKESTLGKEFPVLIEEISPLDARYSGRFTSTHAATIDLRVEPQFNGKPISEALADSMMAILLNNPSGVESVQWSPSKDDGPLFFKAVDGSLLQLDDSIVELNLKRQYYYGYLHELPSTLEYANSQTGSVQLFIKPEELLDYSNRFARYNMRSDIPRTDMKQLYCIVTREGRFTSLPLSVRRIG